MRKVFLFVLLTLFSLQVFAKTDSLFIAVKYNKWMAGYTARQGETVMDIANRFHVPFVSLAEVNSVNVQSSFNAGTLVYIPMGPYNKVAANKTGSPYSNVYYRLGPGENLYKVSKTCGESQSTLQEWNELPDNNVGEGAVLIVAKILADDGVVMQSASSTQINQTKPTAVSKPATPAKDTSSTPAKYTIRKVAKEVIEDGKKVIYLTNDTVWADTLGVYGKLYMQQTVNETKITEEKGAAVFYTLTNKVQSRYTADANKKTYIYAFHKTAKRGTIIKVTNPSNNKFVFVKVMGPLPDTKQYYNSIMGISSDAKEPLEALEEKLWVELKYAP